jgi:hypothetical protein
MLVKDIIKIRYSNDGYLPAYPYHMISDKEVISAFADSNGAGFFRDNYPCLVEEAEFIKSYNQLFLSIMYYMCMKYNIPNTDVSIPDWVYSYMLGSTISINSDSLDIHDLSVSLGTSNMSDEFNAACSKACLEVSKQWLGKYDSTIDVPEIYVGKLENFLNIRIISTLGGESIYYTSGEDPQPIEVNTSYDLFTKVNTNKIYIEPPSMFGEAHVLKALRLQQTAI